MGKWKKKFRTLPKSIRVELQRIVVDDIKVLAGKRISTDDVVAGAYAHLGCQRRSKTRPKGGAKVGHFGVGRESFRSCEFCGPSALDPFTCT